MMISSVNASIALVICNVFLVVKYLFLFISKEYLTLKHLMVVSVLLF